MNKRTTLSQAGRRMKRAVAVAMTALLLGVLAAPHTGLAAPIRPRPTTITHIVHPTGNGDSPVVP